MTQENTFRVLCVTYSTTEMTFFCHRTKEVITQGICLMHCWGAVGRLKQSVENPAKGFGCYLVTF